jgi:hypothetical protein
VTSDFNGLSLAGGATRYCASRSLPSLPVEALLEPSLIKDSLSSPLVSAIGGGVTMLKSKLEASAGIKPWSKFVPKLLRTLAVPFPRMVRTEGPARSLLPKLSSVLVLL